MSTENNNLGRTIRMDPVKERDRLKDAVVEAARAVAKDGEDWDAWRTLVVAFEGLDAFDQAHKALSAHDAKAEAEMVEVRAHVRFDGITRERYVIQGGGRIDGTDDDPPSGRAFATIRARVPLPRVLEVTGEVEG